MGDGEGFRRELRSWLDEHFTAEVADAVRDRVDPGAFAAFRA